MKNVTIRKGWQWMLTALLVLAVSMPAFAQDAIWTIDAPTSNYFVSSDTERGLTYNPATGHLILASRQGGVTPVLIDAATGDSLGVLDNTGIAGGIFAFNQIRATADGQIFTANLVLGGEGVKIYRWADETSAPQLVFDGTMDNLTRFGDALGAWGTGNDVTVLLSGTNTGVIAKFTWDGTQMTKTDEFTVPQGVGRGGFSHGIYGENNDIVWAAGTGAAPVPFNIDSGAVGNDLVSADVDAADLNSSMLIDQADFNGKTWIATGPAFTNGTFYLFELDEQGNAVLFAQTEPLGENTNGNNTGGVIFDGDNGRLYLMDTNNAIAAYDLVAVTTPIIDIAEARGLDGQFVGITGLANTPNYGFNNGQWYLQDETGGINLILFGVPIGDLPISAGDEHIIYGTVGAFNDQVQIDVSQAQVVSTGNPAPEATSITLEEFNNLDSEFQGMYVALEGMARFLPDLGAWPVDPISSGSGLNVYFQVGQDTVEYRIDRGESELDGSLAPDPTKMYALSGTLSRFRDTPQLFGFFEGDVMEMEVPDSSFGPFNFEDDGIGADLVWNTFENVDNPPVEFIENPDKSGANTSDKVAKIIARAAGQPWAGATARGAGEFLFNADNRTISVMVWKDVISPVGIKLETASGWAQPEVQVSNTVTGQWELLTFDFTGREFPPAGEAFNGVSIFPDFNTDGRGQENVVYFDNISFSGFEAIETVEPVMVHFMINTSTALDTLQEYHSVQVRGGFVGTPQSSEAITWDAGTSVVATNVGGDYWMATAEMYPGDSLNYKVFPSFDDGAGIFNGSETGWESGGNTLVTVPVDYDGTEMMVEHWYETRENPFMEKTDSVGIKFRVNMGAQLQDLSFDPETMTVGVRGDINGWGPDIVTLEDEGTANGDNRFYSGIVYVPDTLFQSTTGMFNYKYIFTDGTDTFWEDGDNKVAHVPAADTTIMWSFFNGKRPTDALIVSTELSFNVDVGILEGVGYFDSSIDSVQVRGGLNGWGDSDKMTFNPISFTWGLSGRAYTAAEGSQIAYKYYIDYDESRFDETSANYIPGINNDFGYEEPGIVGGGNRFYNIQNAATQTVDQAAFYNGVEPEGVFTTPVDVTFRVDMTPATTRDDGGAAFVPSSDSVYIVFETKYFALIQGIQPGIDGITASGQEVAEQFRMTDDNEDGIYEVTFSIEQFNLNHIGFVIAYGQPFNDNGEFNANGGGFDAGRRYYQYVQPLVGDNGAVSWPQSFTMPTLTWQRENLPYEDVPDYQTPTSNEGNVPVAKEFALEQNYPNPFNPSTNITFTLPSSSNVRLSVYNILGQQVVNIFDGKQMSSGVHTVNFDASNLSSGTYIYRLEAGGNVAIKKMTLIK